MSFEKPATVDDLLNFRLARLHASSGALVLRLCEGRYGITRREWRLIALLAAHGPMSPSVLAERAHIDRARTSRVITLLMEKKLVSRSRVPGDYRRAEVALTEAGRKLYRELFPQSAALSAQLLEVLTQRQRRELDRILDLLTREADAMARTMLPVDVKADRRHGGSRRVRREA
ncbi:MAG TPA: MarR family transcriptional regulator [Burkholderiales bacterium]